MKIDKEKLRELTEKSDSDLWETICAIASKNGISLPAKSPSAEELAKIRAALSDADRMNLIAAMKLINKYKRGS